MLHAARCASLMVCVLAGCAGQASSAATEPGRTRGETCASVVQPGVDAAMTERLERASNVLEYESIWQDAHPDATRGTISGSEVRARIRAHAAEIRGCYESALDRLPAGEGRVAVRFIVEASGRVPAVTVASNDFQDPEVGCCVANHVARWTFPAPTSGGFVVVEYPFVVRTSKS